jgi:hypothetical protein
MFISMPLLFNISTPMFMLLFPSSSWYSMFMLLLFNTIYQLHVYAAVSFQLLV